MREVVHEDVLQDLLVLRGEEVAFGVLEDLDEDGLEGEIELLGLDGDHLYDSLEYMWTLGLIKLSNQGYLSNSPKQYPQGVNNKEQLIKNCQILNNHFLTLYKPLILSRAFIHKL